METGKIIVMANQKGGVAKTSSTRNLAYSLAELGKKVLAVDFDPQTNLTISFGVAPAALQETTASLMMKLPTGGFPMRCKRRWGNGLPSRMGFRRSHSRISCMPWRVSPSMTTTSIICRDFGRKPKTICLRKYRQAALKRSISSS